MSIRYRKYQEKREGNKNYGKNEFALYQKEQNKDKGSRVENIF